MADEPVFPGFHYDLGKALSIADLLRTTLQVARNLGADVPDIFAALAIAGAREILASRVERAPQTVSEAVAALTVALVGRRELLGPIPPPPETPARGAPP